MSVEVVPPLPACESHVDSRGRVKISPTLLPSMAAYSKWFVCSLDAEIIRMYPAGEWQRVKRKLQSQGPGSVRVISFAERYGFLTQIDSSGRILIPHPLFDVVVRTECVWLYWRDGHVLVLNREQHEKRQRSPEEKAFRSAYLAPLRKMLDSILEESSEKSKPGKETIH